MLKHGSDLHKNEKVHDNPKKRPLNEAASSSRTVKKAKRGESEDPQTKEKQPAPEAKPGQLDQDHPTKMAPTKRSVT